MKDWIKSDRIVFKFASLEWSNFYGLPIGFLGLSLINLTFVFQTNDYDKQNVFIIGFITLLIIGIVSGFIQYRRLKFKSFPIDGNTAAIKSEIKSLLIDADWRIDYDNKSLVQATYTRSMFNHDMITLKFKSAEIQWNVIHHPHSYNSIAALFSINREGKRMIKKIKAMTIQLN